eukprot:scaffold4768_cov412-Prasinococcus_capsulatus_cf.AAC.19
MQRAPPDNRWHKFAPVRKRRKYLTRLVHMSRVARRALAPLSGLACRVAPTAAEQAIAPAALSTSSLLSGAAGSFVNQARQHAGSTEGTTAYHVRWRLGAG